MRESMLNKSKDRFGLRSHAVPLIIAIAYLVDSLDVKMTLLRALTLILAGCYVVVIIYSGIRMFIELWNESKSEK